MKNEDLTPMFLKKESFAEDSILTNKVYYHHYQLKHALEENYFSSSYFSSNFSIFENAKELIFFQFETHH